MNQLETNLVLWAICSILLFEILVIICLCRFCFNRIKPKRFYVKREEFEYLQGVGGTSSQFQSIILRPPHADELAVVGTIREQNPPIHIDNGNQNFGFYHDNSDDEIISPTPTSLPTRSPSAIQHSNWIELRPPPSLTSTGIINTAQLSPADYEMRSYPIDDYLYTRQPSPPPRSTVIDFHQYRNEYDNDDHFKNEENDADDDDDDDDELVNFQFHPLRHSDMFHSYTQRKDTSTESFGGNYSTLMPKSILKINTSTTPSPLDLLTTPYFQAERSRTSSKYDESPRTSVKINTDESISIDYPTSAIEKTTPMESIITTNIPITLLSTPNRMRFASVSQLNEIEWEVPREFHTVVYDINEDRQPLRNALIFSSNDNLNNNNNNNNNEKLLNRQRSQSADVDQRTHVSRIFVPWNHKKKVIQSFYLSNNIEQGDITQQQAFEY
ncbi:unnamed protein product [Adineta steineri]|uniref:Uncharacterized protein n=1 Tax=Adineta steineri TaxID=433720 RepID=A0A813UJF7_9BILA|nr:unnamed protein product [Adineta steineri]CAF1016746.1 unnamed protein product [Adineta steineri]